MKWLMTLTLLTFAGLACSQSVSNKRITGTVIDSQSNRPIAYANIGIVGKHKGTVSDADGHFELSIEETAQREVIRFSMIGYYAIDFSASELIQATEPMLVKLEEKITALDEVLVESKRQRPEVLGIKRKACYPMPMSDASTDIMGFADYRGEEIGSSIPLGPAQVYMLDSVRLNFKACSGEQIRFRLNIYVNRDGKEVNVLHSPLQVTLSKKELLSYPVIDLTSYGLVLSEDFIVAIENIEGIGGLAIFANAKSKGRVYPALQRKNNQSEWLPIHYDDDKQKKPIGISFLVFVH